jgi:type III secretory pathway component EscS
MDSAAVVDLAKQAVLLTLWVSAPLLGAIALVGLLVGFVQALTQLQDQALPQVFKIGVVLLLIVLLGGWMGAQIHRYALLVFSKLPLVG